MFYFLLLFYVCFLANYVVQKLQTPTFKILVNKIQLPSKLTDPLHVIPDSLVLFFVSFVCCLRREIGNPRASTTGFGLLCFNILLKSSIIPIICQLNFTHNVFSNLPFKFIYIIRDYFFSCLGLGLLFGAFAFKAIRFSRNEDRECELGEEYECCYQRLINIDNFEFERVEKGEVHSEEVGYLLILFICYICFIFVQDQIYNFCYSIHLRWNNEASTLSSEGTANQRNSFLLFFKYGVHGSGSKMKALSQYFISRSPITLLYLFHLMDEDKSNSIDYSEFSRGFQSFGIDLKRKDAISLIQYIDIDRIEQGKVKLQSFTRWLVMTEVDLLKEANLLFDVLDFNDDLKVKVSEVKEAFLDHRLINSKDIALYQNFLDYSSNQLISKRQYYLWVRSLLFCKRQTKFDLYYCSQLNTEDLIFVDNFHSFIENSNPFPKLKEVIISRIPNDVNEIDFYQYDDYFAFPVLVLLKWIIFPTLGEFKDLNLFTAFIWNVILCLLLFFLSILITFFIQSISLTLKIPFEISSFFILGPLLSFSKVYSLVKRVYNDIEEDSTEQSEAQLIVLTKLGYSYSSMLVDIVIAFPLSLSFAIFWGNTTILFSNYDTNLFISLIALLEFLICQFLFFILTGFQTSKTQILLNLTLIIGFAIQFIYFARFNDMDKSSDLYVVCSGCSDDYQCFNSVDS